jgi:predicted nucleic acid-binding protein
MGFTQRVKVKKPAHASTGLSTNGFLYVQLIFLGSTIDCLIAQLCLRDQQPLLCKDRDYRAIVEYFLLILVE